MRINPQFRPRVLDSEFSETQFPGSRTARSGRRYYDGKQGRFLGRDPKAEKGGLNLYGFCGNNGVNRLDYLGMNTIEQRPSRVGEVITVLESIEGGSGQRYRTYRAEFPNGGIEGFDELIWVPDDQLIGVPSLRNDSSFPADLSMGSSSEGFGITTIIPADRNYTFYAPPSSNEELASSSAKKMAFVLRISPFSNGKTDTNAKYYSKHIEETNLSFRERNIISERWQLQFATANDIDSLRESLSMAMKYNGFVVFAMHGNPSNNSQKNAFGVTKSSIDLMDEWNALLGRDFLTTSNSIFVSCDEDNGSRPPSWQVENRIAPELISYFRDPKL